MVVKEPTPKKADGIGDRLITARELEVHRDHCLEEVINRIRNLRRSLPPSFTFDRDEANER